jgi:hypothetical protein
MSDPKSDDLIRGFKEGLQNLQDLVSELNPEDAYDYGWEASHAALAPIAWSKAIGHRLNTTEVTKLLGITRQALAHRLNRKTILGIPGKNTTYYPSWQFDFERRIQKSEARGILCTFLSYGQNDSYMIAAWANSSNEDLEGLTPAQWLQEERTPSNLYEVARETAHSWSH